MVFVSSCPPRCCVVGRSSSDRRGAQFRTSYVKFDAFIVVTSWCCLTLSVFVLNISVSHLLSRGSCASVVLLLPCSIYLDSIISSV